MERIVIILLIFLCLLNISCGFHGELIETQDGFKWKSNRPCILKKDKIEVDGKAEPFFKIQMPDIVGGKISQ